MTLRTVVFFSTVFFLLGCVSPNRPYAEYTFAQSALEAARSVQAVRYSSGFWHQAEEAYRQAKILYSNRDFEEAKNLFIKARLSAEKAENSARLIRQKNGDIL
jgi:hypothetical protein